MDASCIECMDSLCILSFFSAIFVSLSTLCHCPTSPFTSSLSVSEYIDFLLIELCLKNVLLYLVTEQVDKHVHLCPKENRQKCTIVPLSNLMQILKEKSRQNSTKLFKESWKHTVFTGISYFAFHYFFILCVHRRKTRKRIEQEKL